MISKSLLVACFSLSLVVCEKSADLSQTTNNASTIVNSNLTTRQISEVMTELREAGMDVSRDDSGLTVTARMKMSNFINPLMFVPSLIAWGFVPILLANLKLFVFQALMINKMALSSAIYMTLKNIVFGPRPGKFVKYANFGYGTNEFHHHHHHRRRVANVRL